MHRRRNPDRRQSLRDRTFYQNVDDLHSHETPSRTARFGLENRLNTDTVPTNARVTNEVALHEQGYAWRKSGYSHCSLSCGGGLLHFLYYCTNTVNLSNLILKYLVNFMNLVTYSVDKLLNRNDNSIPFIER